MKFFLGMVVGIGASLIVYGLFINKHSAVVTPIIESIQRPLDKYTIDNLTARGGVASEIVLDEAVATTSAYTVYNFHFTSENKKVTGLAHVPRGPEPANGFPVIVQFRGYIDRTTFVSGAGTRRSAEYFASHGFISYAPDFLGYGGSDNPSVHIFEERFQTYTTALDLLASIKSARVGIWAHSNGGHIALTVLEILQKPYPLVLWAPVTAPFPYSILFYTNEADDKGKFLRKKLAEFEALYDVDLYALTNYIDRIVSPMQIHQGGVDDAIPQSWTDDFVTMLHRAKKDVRYFVYPQSDHDMRPDWNTVVSRDVLFYNRFFTTEEK